MSMLGEQIKELREAARNMQGKLGRCLYRRKDVDEMQHVSGMLSEAADTIESLRDKLQADVLGSRTCEREKRGTKPDGTPRYRCSVCGYGLGDYRWAYCPKCGRCVKGE